ARAAGVALIALLLEDHGRCICTDDRQHPGQAERNVSEANRQIPDQVFAGRDERLVPHRYRPEITSLLASGHVRRKASPNAARCWAFEQILGKGGPCLLSRLDSPFTVP